MSSEEKVLMGITGTMVSAAGTGLSVTDVQAIVSIIVTVAGFIISVFIPLMVKLYHKIKKATKDGVVTKDEAKDIADTAKEIVDESSKFIEEVSDKESEGD